MHYIDVLKKSISVKPAKFIPDWLLSRSIYIKSVVIGLCVSGILSAFVLYQLHISSSHIFSSIKEDEASLLISVVEDNFKHHTDPFNMDMLSDLLDSIVANTPGLLYISVIDDNNNLLAFTDRLSSDNMFLKIEQLPIINTHDQLVYEHFIENTSLKIILVMDTVETKAQANTLVLQTALWLFVSIILAHVILLVLMHLLTRPVNELLCATESLRKGNMKTRAKVYYDDEVGKLAKAFNELADNLQLREKEILEKEQARLSLMKRIVHNQETERKSIARNLHDEIGQSLSHLLIKVNALCSKCSNTLELSNGLTHLIDETRQLAWDFRPSILDDYGLESALKRYAQEHLTPLNIVVKCESINFDLERKCCCHTPNEIEISLYRIAQEALTNIIRHANAKNVSVILLRNNCNLTLILEDDGCGFNFENMNNGRINHLGIIGMKERAQLIGGELTIETFPGEGTIVRVTISLRQVAV